MGYEQIGLKQFILYEYHLQNCKRKTMFSKTLHGRKSWYLKKGKKVVKKYPGIADNEEIIFSTIDEKFQLYHSQNCCEHVRVEEIIGDLGDLLNSPILLSEEVINEPKELEYGESETWTFYKLSTIKGSVTLRWVGSSNGYYSEDIDFERIKDSD